MTEEVAELLSTAALDTVRLAYDYSGMKRAYVTAIRRLARHGFREFTNYVMFNCGDPRDFYERIRLNVELSQELNIRISGFPMKYSPVNEVNRRYVAPGWKWRYLRGIQCVLLATHGLVSPNVDFFNASFGSNYEEFLEILSMPDRYIIHREKYKDSQAADWRRRFCKLSLSRQTQFLDSLAMVVHSRDKPQAIRRYKPLPSLIEHYYPGGAATPCE